MYFWVTFINIARTQLGINRLCKSNGERLHGLRTLQARARESTMVPDACECKVPRKQQFHEDRTTCLSNVGYTTRQKCEEEGVSDGEGRTEGGPNDNGIIGVEELQVTVEALLQKALESVGTQHNKSPLERQQ